MIAPWESKLQTEHVLQKYTYEIRFCGASGQHEDLYCANDEIVIVNFKDGSWQWDCGPDDLRCPGAFQVGCEPDPSYTTTTTTTTTTTENGASSIFSISAFIMAVATSVLVAGA